MAMKKLFGIALLVFVLGMIVYRVITHGEVEPVKSISQIQMEEGVPVEVAPVERKPLREVHHFTGTVEGIAQADAQAGMSQELRSILVHEGEFVREGQVVAELDVNSASAMVLRYVQAKASLDEAKRDYERKKSLYESGAISLSEFEKAKDNYEVAESNYRGAEKMVKIKAPIGGVVTHIFVKEGETVNAGTPIVRVAKLEEVLVQVNVNESEIAHLRPGQKAEISVAARPEMIFQGKVDRVSLSADPRTRTFAAWIRLANPQYGLRPGMFAKVKIFTEAKANVLTIPKDAVLRKGDQTLAFVVGEDRKATLCNVNLGISDGSLVEVREGLHEGQMVVVNGHNNLAEGARVKVVE